MIIRRSSNPPPDERYNSAQVSPGNGGGISVVVRQSLPFSSFLCSSSVKWSFGYLNVVIQGWLPYWTHSTSLNLSLKTNLLGYSWVYPGLAWGDRNRCSKLPKMRRALISGRHCKVTVHRKNMHISRTPIYIIINSIFPASSRTPVATAALKKAILERGKEASTWLQGPHYNGKRVVGGAERGVPQPDGGIKWDQKRKQRKGSSGGDFTLRKECF